MDCAKPPPADISLVVLLLTAVCLITLSMLFSIAESSFLSINKLRLRSKINRKDKRALRSGNLLKNKEKMLNSLLIANELVNILLSAILTSTALKLFRPAGVGIATFTATLLLLIFGEITPKAVSTRHPDAFAYGLSFFVQATVKILSPVVLVFTFISRIILRLFGITIKKNAKSFSEEEIKTIIDVGGEEGVLDQSEHKMMHRVFTFTDLASQTIMIPRTHIVAIPFSATYNDILELSERTAFSRFPVYRKDIDDIVGVLYVKDLLLDQGHPKNFMMQNCIRPPLFIPGTKNISYAQHMLAEAHQSLAIVIDEYSGTDGILTKEDIVTEIFGIIKTNSAKSRTAFILNKIEDNPNQVLPGETRLISLQEALNIPITSDINETIGGWIAEKLDHFPENKEFIDFSGYRFTVEDVSAHKINKVCIQNLSFTKSREDAHE